MTTPTLEEIAIGMEIARRAWGFERLIGPLMESEQLAADTVEALDRTTPRPIGWGLQNAQDRVIPFPKRRERDKR